MGGEVANHVKLAVRFGFKWLKMLLNSLFKI